jgi:hypothetical protein
MASFLNWHHFPYFHFVAVFSFCYEIRSILSHAQASAFSCPKNYLNAYNIQCNNMNTGHETVQQQQHSEQNGMSDTMLCNHFLIEDIHIHTCTP